MTPADIRNVFVNAIGGVLTAIFLAVFAWLQPIWPKASQAIEQVARWIWESLTAPLPLPAGIWLLALIAVAALPLIRRRFRRRTAIPPLAAGRTVRTLDVPTQLVQISGNQQVVAQHEVLAEAMVVRVIDASGTGIQGVPVHYFPDATTDHFRGVTIKTDADGLAGWKGYFHSAGQQIVIAAADGVGRVTFVVEVKPAGRKFDGVYALNNSEGNPLRGLADPTIEVKDGAVVERHLNGPYSASLSESDGSIHFTLRAGKVARDHLIGNLTIDSTGRATGGGTIEREHGGGRESKGTWSVERL